LFISLLGLAATLYIGIQIPQQLNSILSKKQGLQNRLINQLDSLENELAASYILVNAAHIDKKAWKKISEHLDNCGKILTKTEKMIKISYKKEKHLINLQNSIENFESFITNFHSNVSITLDNKREMKKLYENAQNDVIRSLELIYRL